MKTPNSMKKGVWIYSIFFVGILTNSCSKDEVPVFQSYFKMTIDGTREVKADLEIRASGPPSLSSLYGRWSTGELSISLFQYNNSLGKKIVEGSGAPIILRFNLYDPGQTSYYAGDNGPFGTVTGSGMINILEISNEYVKGTFEFVAIGGSGVHPNEIKTVTNGEFHIKRGP